MSRSPYSISLVSLALLLFLLSDLTDVQVIPRTCAETVKPSTEDDLPGVDHTGTTDEGDVDTGNNGLVIGKNSASAITFLNLFSSPSSTDVPPAVFSDGLYAALRGKYGSSVLDGGLVVNVVETLDPDRNVSENLDLALKMYPHLLGVLGPLGDDTLNEVMEYNTKNNLQLTAIGPYTRYSSSLGWDPNKYFIRAPPKAEIYAMVTHLVTGLQVKRVGLMTLVGFEPSEAIYNTIISSLNAVHNIVPIEFRQSVDDKVLDMDAFDAFLDKRPQVVIVNAGASPASLAFVEQFSLNPKARGIPLYIGSEAFHMMNEVINKGLPHDFYFTWTNAMANDTDFAYVYSFEGDMKTFLDSGDARYFHSYDEVKQSILSGLTVYGWIVGQVLLKAVQDPAALVDLSSFQKSLFDQRQYNIGGDNLIGPFGGNCFARDFQQQITCKCNQGGHTVHIFHSTNEQTASPNMVFSLPRQTCGSDDFSLPFYNEAVLLFHEEHEGLLQVARNLMHGTSLVVANQDKSKEVLVSMAVNLAKYKNVTKYAEDTMVDVIVGPVVDTKNVVNELHNVLILDPIDVYPLPRIDNPMVVYLMPTMDQQIYITADVAKTNGYTCGVVLRRSPEYDAISTIIHNAASKYGINIQIHTVEEGDPLVESSAAVRQEFVLLIGLHATDIPFVRNYLENHPSVCFTVLFDQFTVLYDALTRSFENASTDVQKRLLVQTNLPTWSDFREETAASNPVLKAYHASFPEKTVTSPSSLQAWYTANVVQQMTSSRFDNVAMDMKESVYFYSTYNYGNVTFGKLGLPTMYPQTIHNYAASNINLISFLHLQDPTVPPVFGPYTPDLSSTKSTAFDFNMILAVSIPLTVTICCITGILIYFCCCPRRDVIPPRNPNRPVTLLVCDIYRSAGLWASHPREMLKATDAYQSIVRKLIRDLHCYEVKLVGDAFLIASDDAVNIVNLSVAVQRALYEHDWGTYALDAFYIRNVKNAAMSFKQKEGDYNNAFLKHLGNATPNTVLTEYEIRELVESEPYCHMWNGLRVRMGIHTGFCEMSCSEGANKVDYHGDTVHIAARSERCARGGQILMTQSTWDYLREGGLLSSLYADIAVSDAGVRTLRGIALPVQMYEVEAIEDREWRKNLLEELEVPLQQESLDEDNVDLLYDSQHCGECYTPEAHRVHRFVTGLFFPLCTSTKLAQLMFLMDQWHIPTHVSPENMKTEDKLSILLCRFSNRTANMFALQENVALAQERQKQSLSSLDSVAVSSCGCRRRGTRRCSSGTAVDTDDASLPRGYSCDSYDVMHAVEADSVMEVEEGGTGGMTKAPLLPFADGFSQLVVSFTDGLCVREGKEEENEDAIVFPMPLAGTSSTMAPASLASLPPQFQYQHDNNPLEKMRRPEMDHPIRSFTVVQKEKPVSVSTSAATPTFTATCTGGKSVSPHYPLKKGTARIIRVEKKDNMKDDGKVVGRTDTGVACDDNAGAPHLCTTRKAAHEQTQGGSNNGNSSPHYGALKKKEEETNVKGIGEREGEPSKEKQIVMSPIVPQELRKPAGKEGSANFTHSSSSVSGRTKRNSSKRVTLAVGDPEGYSQPVPSASRDVPPPVHPHTSPSQHPMPFRPTRKLSSVDYPPYSHSPHHLTVSPPPLFSILSSSPPCTAPPQAPLVESPCGVGAMNTGLVSPRSGGTTGVSADFPPHPSPTRRFYPVSAMRRNTDFLVSSGLNSHDPSIREFGQVLKEELEPPEQSPESYAVLAHDTRETESRTGVVIHHHTEPILFTHDDDDERVESHLEQRDADGNVLLMIMEVEGNEEEEDGFVHMVPSGGASSTVDSTYLRKAGPPPLQPHVFPSLSAPRAGAGRDSLTAGTGFSVQHREHPPYQYQNSDANTVVPSATVLKSSSTNTNRNRRNSSTAAKYIPLSSPLGMVSDTTSGCFAGVAGVDFSFT